MKINVNHVLKTIDGQSMKDNVNGEAIDATVKMAIVNAVLSPVDKETGVKKLEKYQLAQKVYNADGEVELSAEEISLIKKQVGEVFPPIIVGQVFNLLEGKGE